MTITYTELDLGGNNILLYDLAGFEHFKQFYSSADIDLYFKLIRNTFFNLIGVST